MIARGGEKLVIIVMILMMVTVLVSYLISIALAVLLIIILIIFRDPDVPIASGIISPADGKILNVDKERKSILLQIDLLGKRVIRAPISGTIENCPEIKSSALGRTRVQWTDHTDNFTMFTINSPNVSARISTLKKSKFSIYARPSDNVLKGDRIGLLPQSRLIRIDLSGPSVRILVRPGMLILAGESTLAKIHKVAGRDGVLLSEKDL